MFIPNLGKYICDKIKEKLAKDNNHIDLDISISNNDVDSISKFHYTCLFTENIRKLHETRNDLAEEINSKIESLSNNLQIIIDIQTQYQNKIELLVVENYGVATITFYLKNEKSNA